MRILVREEVVLSGADLRLTLIHGLVLAWGSEGVASVYLVLLLHVCIKLQMVLTLLLMIASEVMRTLRR